MTPLTPTLLALRLEQLRDVVAGEVDRLGWQPVDEQIERIFCDGCGAVCDLTRGFPTGWSTRGDLVGGFTDLCPNCA